MKITEVRIFPTESKDGKLKAFATMTFDDWFVVRNVKIIQGTSGLFVAMPSRRAMVSCSKCRTKNAVGSKFCNQCGAQITQTALPQETSPDAQASHMDIAHPVTQECRVYIQEKILEAYNKEAKGRPGVSENYNKAQQQPREARAEGPKKEVKPSQVEIMEAGGKDIEL